MGSNLRLLEEAELALVKTEAKVRLVRGEKERLRRSGEETEAELAAWKERLARLEKMRKGGDGETEAAITGLKAEVRVRESLKPPVELELDLKLDPRINQLPYNSMGTTLVTWKKKNSETKGVNAVKAYLYLDSIRIMSLSVRDLSGIAIRCLPSLRMSRSLRLSLRSLAIQVLS